MCSPDSQRVIVEVGTPILSANSRWEIPARCRTIAIRSALTLTLKTIALTLIFLDRSRYATPRVTCFDAKQLPDPFSGRSGSWLQTWLASDAAYLLISPGLQA
jgi:hypothetical protein